MKRFTSVLRAVRASGILFPLLAGSVVQASADTNYVQKTGDTMTGPLTVMVQGDTNNCAPGVVVEGSSGQFKYVELRNSDNSAAWDISMEAGSNDLAFCKATPDNVWTIAFKIDSAGVLHGNAAGLSNLNVALAIPDGTVTGSKLAAATITSTQLADNSVTGSKIPNASITGAKLADSTITDADISTNAAITMAKIDGLDAVIAEIQAKVASPSNGTRSIVEVTSDAVQNGVNLRTAYATAKIMNPSSTNRVAVIVPPGRYDLGISGLLMDTPYVDLIGETAERTAQYIYGMPDDNAGVIFQACDHVRIENLTICNMSPVNWNWDGSDSAAYFPTVDGTHTVMRNCEFLGGMTWDCTNLTMRIFQNYAGYYENVVAGYGAFGLCASASGTFIDCTAGCESFGTYSEASGAFRNCYAMDYSFGCSADISGLFENCSAGAYSFGAWGNIATNAVLKNCSAGTDSFGGYIAASDNFNYNASGHIYEGGPLVGDGSGLTHLNLSDSVGLLKQTQLPALTVSDLPTDGEWKLDGLSVSGIEISDITGAAGRKIEEGAAHYYYQPVFNGEAVSFEPIVSKDGVVQRLARIKEQGWQDEVTGDTATFVDSPCLILSAGDYIQLTASSGISSISNNGTALVEWDAITKRVKVVGAGTVYNLRCGPYIYPVSECDGAIIHDVSGQKNNGRIVLVSGSLSLAWAGRQDDHHYSLKNGYSKALYFETGSSSSERIDSGVGVGDRKFTAYQLFQPNEWSTPTVAHSYMGSSDYLQHGWRVGCWRTNGIIGYDFEKPGGGMFLGYLGASLFSPLSAHHMFVRVDITNNYSSLNIDDRQTVSSANLSIFVPSAKPVLFMHGRQGGWSTPGGNLYRCAYWNRKLSDAETEQVKNGFPDDVPDGLIFYRDEARGIYAGTVLSGDVCEIPAEMGSEFDVCGSALTNPGGDFHNGAITKLRQSETNKRLKAVDDGFWYNSDGSVKAVGYDDLLTEASERISLNISAGGKIANVTTHVLDGDAGSFAKEYGSDLGGGDVAEISNADSKFSVYAPYGIRLVAGSNATVEVTGALNVSGPITGNGSGLTGLPAGNLVGTVPVANLPPEALQNGGASDWSQLTGVPAGIWDGVDNVLTDSDIACMGYVKTDKVLSETEVDAYVTDNGFAITTNTYTKAEADDRIAAAVAGIDLSNIGVYGDINMGSFQ